METVPVQLRRNEEDRMYTCRCCESIHSRKDHPPIAGMCPECHSSHEKALVALYNNVERGLSHMISTHAGDGSPIDRIMRDLIKIRDSLRKTMRTMGWQGPF